MASLSYLDVLRLTGDVFMGGLMTVNEMGLPVEFIYSEPLKPSMLQMSLYGSTLGQYLMLDVVGKGLVEASKTRGEPVIVGQGELLKLATKVKRPLCQVRQTNLRPMDKPGEIKENSPEEFAVQLAEVQSPYIFRIFDRVNFPLEQHLSTFMDCTERFDIVEPLARVKRTLEIIKDNQSV